MRDDSRMSITRRVYVSMPADEWLTAAQNELKWKLVEKIERLTIEGSRVRTEIFNDPRGSDSLASAFAWSAQQAEDIMRRCIGAVLIGLPRWTFDTPEGIMKIATEFCHYEGAVARTLQLPMMVLVQKDVQRRVVFNYSFGGLVTEMPSKVDASWLAKKEFIAPFGVWRRQLENRRDVFLGYSGASKAIAKNIERRLADDDVTVLDWQTDFKPARRILEQIEEAGERCGAAVFLFTKDDLLSTATPTADAVPRDNVVFEAGYFIRAKGKDRVLIIREAGAKMLADLGGDIYGTLRDRSKPGAMPELRRFIMGL
jgi:hypothetical protein